MVSYERRGGQHRPFDEGTHSSAVAVGDAVVAHLHGSSAEGTDITEHREGHERSPNELETWKEGAQVGGQ